jgi:hypothetical protein
MVKEDALLPRGGIELSVLCQFQRGLGEAVGLTRGVQAEHVGFVLVRPDDRVDDWKRGESVHRKDEDQQRETCGIANPLHTPRRVKAIA